MSWENELDNSINTIGQLKEYLNVSEIDEKKLTRVLTKSPMSITPYYAALIDWDNPDDPMMKMVVPSIDELDISGSYDTSGELTNTKIPGLQHKYARTVLLLFTNKCFNYCRYCFRKRFVGQSQKEILHNNKAAIDYIKSHKEIRNVLISGGDPIMQSTKEIERLLEPLSRINHIRSIRFGTKAPVSLPDRILKDKSLVNLLNNYSTKKKRIYMVTQFNHPKEITENAVESIMKLLDKGIIFKNQTVMLKGVNDNPETLIQLQQRLVSIGINPYYVFQCRPVKRVMHRFQTTLYDGYNVVESAKAKLDGLGKCFRYIMSNKNGKLEVINVTDKEIHFKYHQAKNELKIGKFIRKRIDKKTSWLF